MKGALGDPIPFVLLVLGASIMGFQLLGINSAMSQEVIDSFQDLERVGQSKQAFDLHFHEFLRQAGEYSLHQTAYELGGRGGGNFGWNHDSDLGQERFESLYEVFKENSQDYLNANYDIGAATRQCDIPEQEWELTPNEDPVRDLDKDPENDTRFSITNPESQEVTCSFGSDLDADVEYREASREFETRSNATDNRYMQMAHTASFLFQKVKGNLTQGVEEEYVGESDEVCGEPGVSEHIQAEERAEEKIRTDISSEKQEAEEPFPEFGGLEIDEFRALLSQNLAHGTNTENFCVNPGCESTAGPPQQTHDEIQTDDVCDSECVDYDSEEDECDRYEYTYYWYVEERIRPLGTIFYFNLMPKLEDGTRERIPTEDGWRPLRFQLFYVHNYQDDGGGSSSRTVTGDSSASQLGEDAATGSN